MILASEGDLLPSLLYLVSQLWKDEGLAKHVGEINSAFVMDLFIQATYQRQIQKTEGKPDFMMLSPEEHSFFMLGIAAYMAANKLPNQITVHQLDDAVSKLFAVIPEDISETSSAMSGKTPRPLRERLCDNESALETIGTDVRAAGLLVVDPTRSGAFRFAHKSFLEFLSAKVMAEKLWAKTDTATAIATATELGLSKVREVGSECVDFLAEVLNNRIVESAEVQYESKENLAASLYQIIVGGGEKLSWIVKYAVGEYLARLRMLQSRASVWATLTRSFFSRSTLVMGVVCGAAAYVAGSVSPSLSSEGRPERLIFVVVYGAVMGGAVMAQLSFLFGLTRRGELGMRLTLWYACCHRLGLDGMQKIVGSSGVQVLEQELWSLRMSAEERNEYFRELRAGRMSASELRESLSKKTHKGVGTGDSPSPAKEEFMMDFFVSYNAADQAWAEWIAWTLEEAGYSVVIQSWDFRPGENFILEMQKAAESSEKTIAVLSASYLDALYTQPEWAAALVQDPRSENAN